MYKYVYLKKVNSCPTKNTQFKPIMVKPQCYHIIEPAITLREMEDFVNF